MVAEVGCLDGPNRARSAPALSESLMITEAGAIQFLHFHLLAHFACDP